MTPETIGIAIPVERVAEPLAREIVRALFCGDGAAALHPAVAELVREGVARAAERYLRGREVRTIDELAAAFGWSVRRWRAWATKVGLPTAVPGEDLYRVEAVRAKMDFADGAKSAARQELEKRIAEHDRQLGRLLDAEKRRDEAQRTEASLHVLEKTA